MARSVEGENRPMLRARDAMDRDFALPLDVARLAQVAHVSEAHFIRSFKVTFGETPHRYLQRRRIERPMPAAPSCFVKVWGRPSSYGEAS
jgi:AraC-like DNA-binding protein